MTEEEGLQLVTKAISAGALEDLGSGTRVNACIVRREKSEMLLNVHVLGKREVEKMDHKLKPRNIPILKELSYKFEKMTVNDENKMDLE